MRDGIYVISNVKSFGRLRKEVENLPYRYYSDYAYRIQNGKYEGCWPLCKYTSHILFGKLPVIYYDRNTTIKVL